VKRKAGSAHEYRRLFDRTVLPAIGTRRVTDITRQDMAKLHHSRRATPAEANHALAVSSAMFSYAERIGWRPEGSNPCRHITRFPLRRHERFLSADELARLGDALAAYSGSPFAVAAIKLLVFTGARLGEVLGLQWRWIDVERGEVRLPDSKTGVKTLHLPPPALTVLASLPRLEGNPHVVAGAIPGAALVDLERPWRAIRKAAGLDDVRLHDLRHSFASAAVASGMGLPIVGKMLGHTQAATTQRYAHLASDPVKAAAATVANKIAAAMSGEPAAIVKLRQG
jgi:integrase